MTMGGEGGVPEPGTYMVSMVLYGLYNPIDYHT